MPAAVISPHCSFCAKDDPDVAQMISGPGVYICNECVDTCTSILSDPQDEPGGSTLPYWESMTDEEVLERLPRIAAVATQVEANLYTWVQLLRDRRVSWARIGSALAMTRQSAWERFSGEE